MGGKTRDYFEISIKLHELYRGKLEVFPKVPVKTRDHYSVWYTPGVAGPSKKIHEEREKSFFYTWRWNTVAVVTDGTRILGLGNIGPEAGLPVMEGKALLFKYLGGVDAIPLALNTRDPEKFIEVVKMIEPSFGGINLEDIESPKCFYILDKLREVLEIPVWHDDQQGTALVTLAGLFNALKIVGKKISNVKITIVGAGAGGYKIHQYLLLAGAKPENIIVVDSRGIIYDGRPDLDKPENTHKKWVARHSNPEKIQGGIPEALKDSDVLIAISRPGPGVIKKEWIKTMASEPIVFALANPIPEIWPWEAKEAGAKIVATGRSDFPNQINNSLGFPAVFRGALTVMARKITDGMAIEAAKALAKYVEEKGLSEDYIIPSMNEAEAYIKEAVHVALKAIEEGVARRKLSRKELEEEIRTLIERPRKYLELGLSYGLVPDYTREFF